MVTNERDDAFVDPDRRQEVGSEVGMQPHRFHLDRRQGTRLVQDAVGHGQLADVVQERSGLQPIEEGTLVHVELSSQSKRIRLDPPRVTMRQDVSRVERHRELLGDRIIGLAQRVGFLWSQRLCPSKPNTRRQREDDCRETRQPHHGFRVARRRNGTIHPAL